MNNKLIHKLDEVLREIEMLGREYRGEYNGAVDIEVLELAKSVQEAAFEKIRHIKEWKAQIETLKIAVSSIMAQDSNDETDEYSETLKHVNETDAEETKIGRYVRNKMNELSNRGYVFSDEVLATLLAPSTNDRFGFSNPLFRLFDETKDIREQRNIGDYNRYWKEIFTFGDKKLLMCSQWFEYSREAFDAFYTGLLNSETNIASTQVRHEEIPSDEYTDGKSNYVTHGYTKKEPISMTLFGKTEPIKFWNEVLIKVCEAVQLRKPYVVAKFDKMKVLNSGNRINFSYIESDIKFNRKRLSNGLYIEVNRSANDIVSVSEKILELCGYSANELVLEYK